MGTSALSLLLFLVVVLGQTLRAGPITLHRILGAIAAYLLLGVLWAYAYALVAHLQSGAFSGPVRLEDGPRAFFYFSFLTLTTVGYGDVLPVHPAARSLAMLEAVTGPLYLAILVARLVSLGVASDAEPSAKPTLRYRFADWAPGSGAAPRTRLKPRARSAGVRAIYWCHLGLGEAPLGSRDPSRPTSLPARRVRRTCHF